MHRDSLEDLDLRHKFVTMRMYLEAAGAAAEICKVRMIKFPILMVHGDEDEVTSCEAAENFWKGLEAPTKTFKRYPGLRHELHNETDRVKVLTDYLEWMRSIMGNSSNILNSTDK